MRAGNRFVLFNANVLSTGTAWKIVDAEEILEYNFLNGPGENDSACF